MAAFAVQKPLAVALPTQVRHAPCLSRSAPRPSLRCHASSQPQNEQPQTTTVSKVAKAGSLAAAGQEVSAGVRNASAMLGMAAAWLLASQPAEASSEVMQLAAGRDLRFGVVALLFIPVLGWVAFNIGGPALNQLSEMNQKAIPEGVSKAVKKVTNKRRGIVGLMSSLGVMAAAQQADAASEVMQLADRDLRFGVVALLFIPVLGWVAFNIGGPALNQLSEMSKNSLEGGPKKSGSSKTKKRR